MGRKNISHYKDDKNYKLNLRVLRYKMSFFVFSMLFLIDELAIKPYLTMGYSTDRIVGIIVPVIICFVGIVESQYEYHKTYSNAKKHLYLSILMNLGIIALFVYSTYTMVNLL